MYLHFDDFIQYLVSFKLDNNDIDIENNINIIIIDYCLTNNINYKIVNNICFVETVILDPIYNSKIIYYRIIEYIFIKWVIDRL